MSSRSTYITNLVFIGSLILLLANDFFLKNAYPNYLTGKLSDFSGLVVFYGVISFLIGLRLKNLFVVVTLFIYWKSDLSQPLIDAFNSMSLFNISRVIDYSDLMALIVLPVYHVYLLCNRDGSIPSFISIVIFPIALFSITATSTLNPKISDRYDRHVSSYDYSDLDIIYRVRMPLQTFMSSYSHRQYKINDSYYIQPWVGTVHSFTPVDRCSLYAVYEKEGIENKLFDSTEVQLKEVQEGTEIMLYRLTLCHESEPLDEKEAISVFEDYFLKSAGLKFERVNLK